MGGLAMAVMAILSPILGLYRTVAGMAAKAKTAMGSAGAGIRPVGDAEIERLLEERRHVEELAWPLEDGTPRESVETKFAEQGPANFQQRDAEVKTSASRAFQQVSWSVFQQQRKCWIAEVAHHRRHPQHLRKVLGYHCCGPRHGVPSYGGRRRF